MAPRFTVDKLPEEQFQFLVKLIANGGTDRSIPRDFEEQFKVKIAKSSLARWRKAVGNEIADRHRFSKALAAQVVEDLGLEKDADKFQVTMESIGDHIILAGREIISQDPLKLLRIQQEEKSRQLKEAELQLKREQLELEREKVHGVALDRVKLGEDYAADLLEYIGAEPEGLRWFSKHVKPFQEFIKSKYGSATAPN